MNDISFHEELDLYMDDPPNLQFIPQLMSGFRKPLNHIIRDFENLSQEQRNEAIDGFVSDSLYQIRKMEPVQRFINTGALYHTLTVFPISLDCEAESQKISEEQELPAYWISEELIRLEMLRAYKEMTS